MGEYSILFFYLMRSLLREVQLELRLQFKRVLSPSNDNTLKSERNNLKSIQNSGFSGLCRIGILYKKNHRFCLVHKIKMVKARVKELQGTKNKNNKLRYLGASTDIHIHITFYFELQQNQYP